ncbi:protein kinase family protein [Thermocatellispora tengchongensis]|uniref:hypothetical protein n=1 Tax=Thermocatellispora tengchongensis TaxID=1073253 RepID=UPI00363F2F0E
MPAGPLEPGDPRELGVFRVVRRLGEGGQGIVYEGRDQAGRAVAIKVLKGGAEPATRRRLARELEAARRVAPSARPGSWRWTSTGRIRTS